MSVGLVYLVGGVALLLSVLLPAVLDRAWLSAPVVLVALGALLGYLPLPDGFFFDPVDQRSTIEHVSELTVIVALMGVGLALDRPLRWRERADWGAWSASWRLLGIAMPLCILSVFLLGWWGLGVAPAAALLLGAALAPTDPVLAGDVQVEGPQVGENRADDDDEVAETDEVRFALTSEAGLNDGLAFPFVHAAIFLATAGGVANWGARWVAWELVGKIVVGVLIGVVVGRTLGWVAFRSAQAPLRLAERGEALLVVSGVLLAYGAAEVVRGYGFLAVFACALSLRGSDPDNEFHHDMHSVIERLERLLTLTVLLFVGIGVADGTLAHLDWRGVVVGVALVFVIRPVSAMLALSTGRWRLHDENHRPLETREKLITAFFGIRGVGSVYYLAYAMGHATFAEERWLWATGTFTIILSVLVHGVAATPVITRLERDRERLDLHPGAAYGADRA